jgi:SAM-dependent methyltransferase
MPNGIRALAARALRPAVQARGHRILRKRQSLVTRELDNTAALERFAEGAPLPTGYGAGGNERVIEIPWLLAQRPHGKMLDAGSALNHTEYLDHLQPSLDDLHIVTLVYEGSASPERGISYVYADLRSLPYEDECFDTIASISTLEHVGMDNTGYGSDAPASSDPAHEVDLAVAELARVLKRGGRLLVTVPYGRHEDHPTFRQFDRHDLGRLVAAAAPSQTAISVYRDRGDGWELTDLDEASDASYRTDFAAEAVACVCLTR